MTLAILTALLAGATVTPVMAKDVTIDIIDGKDWYYGDESSGGDVTGVNATVTGTTDEIVYVYGGYASGDYNATNNTVNFLADKNGKVNLWMYGGYSAFGDATGNTVMISSGTASGNVFGGKSVNKGDATGNTVMISGGTVSGRVYGGESSDGDATGNKIIIRAGENGETATFGKHTILDGYSGSGTGSDNALIFQGVKNVEAGKVNYFDKYQFLLGDDFNDTDVFLNLTDSLTDRTMGRNAEACVAYANADDTISLMKVTPYSSGISSDGLKLVPYENEAKTASITTAGTFDTTDNNTVLKLKVADVAYKFAISDNANALKNGDAFFTFKRKGTLKVSSDQVTFQNGKLLLSEGDKIYLLKNDEAMGKLEYTATDDAQKWVNTYKNEKATVTTTSAVNQVDNDLVLSVSDVKYAFDLTTAKTGDAAFLTSQNAGTTTIAAKNVDITGNQNTLLNINKGDTFYLLENTTDTGKLAYTGSNTWTHNYEATTDAGTATVATTGTVKADGNDLKLNIDEQTYAFNLSADAKNNDTFLTSTNTGTTKIYDLDLTVANGSKLQPGDTVYLLKNTSTGTVEYTGAKALSVGATYTNEKGDASIATAFTVEQSDDKKNLALKVGDNGTYIFNLIPNARDGYTFIENTNAETLVLQGSKIKLDAADGKMLSLNKGDNVYLLKKTDGTLTYEAAGAPTLNHIYENNDKTAIVTTTGTVTKEDNNLVLNVGDVKYAFTLASDMTDGDTFLNSANTGTTKIYDLDLTVANGSKLQPGDTVYLLKNTSTGTVEYTGAKALSVGATYTNEKGDASIATAFTVEQSDDKKNLALKVGDNGTYIFNLIPNARDGYTFIENTNAETLVLQGSKIKLDAADGKMLSLNKGDNVYLLKKTDGTLTYDSTNAPTLSHTYENSAKNAAVTTTGAVTQEGNNLVLNVSDVAYKFTLAPDMTDGDTFLNSANTGETKISSDDVTLDDSSLSGKLLSFNEGDTLYLLKNTDTGTLTYTEGTATPTLNHTYKNDKSTATVQTTGTVQADGKDLILNIDDVKYTFKLTTDMEKNDPLLTLDNAGETKIGADDVTIDASEWDGKLLSLEKGNSRCLIKNTATGTITYAGNETLNHVINVKNANDMDILKLTTTGTVETDSTNKNLNLDITNVKYSFFLPDGTKNGDTLIELKGETRPRTIDDVEVQAAPDAIMNLNKGDTVCLLDDVASFLGTKDMTQSVNLQYDGTNADGVKTVNITTMGTVGTDSTGIAGKKLNLGVTNVKYSFFLPDGTKNGDTLFTLTNGADTKIDEVAVHAAASDAIMNLNKDDTVYLLKKEGGTLSTENMTQSVDLLYGVTAKLKGIVLQDENNLIFKITDEITGPEADTKSFLETRVAQSSLLNLGADYLVDTTLAQIKDTPDTAYGDDGFTAFGGTQGTAKMRYETGSYVDLNGVVFNAGIAKRQANKRGAFTWGPFFETGSGNYDSYLDNGTHGSGDTSYTGGGLLARQAFASGLYVEGSLRFGRTKADDSSLIEDTRASYDTSSPYFGAHLGVGNLYHVNDADTLDVYGRYLFSRVGSDSVQLSTGEMYDFDDVMSHRLVLGARYTRDYGKTGKGYVGLVYQYEFGGDARAHWNGDSLPSPSVEGSTVRLKTGWTFTPTETSPVALDLGISGSMGKERGIAFHAGVNYAF